MLKKTKGIVISYIKYRDTSIITRIFTRELGLKSYVVNGIRNSKSKPKMALYQPLTLLDLVVYDREGPSLHHISEAKLDYAFQKVPFDFHRSGIALFMGEILGKCIFDDYQNEDLFDFLSQAVELLDKEQVSLGTFPISFLIQMTKYLGFDPEDAGNFYDQLPVNRGNVAHQAKESHLDRLIRERFISTEAIPKQIRKALLDDILLFYQLHLENFTEIKSLGVLRSLVE
jgi:DNA repair protein RecO (recombination protein O)